MWMSTMQRIFLGLMFIAMLVLMGLLVIGADSVIRVIAGICLVLLLIVSALARRQRSDSTSKHGQNRRSYL